MLQISIPKPCHEDWDKMTPNQQGRHCTACAKTVTDFTTMSDEEVKLFFINRTEEKTCGRFRTDQLQRITITLPENIFSIRMAYWKKFLAACLLAFSTTLFSCETKTTLGITLPAVTMTEQKKDSVPPSPGLVGMVFTHDSTTNQTCTQIEQGEIEPATYLTGDIAIRPEPSVLIPDTALVATADSSMLEIKTDSSKIKNLPKADSVICNNENTINL
ncbi:MAG: hypothetical protein QM791_01075 [Ferruginibacter sp.]